MDNLIPELRVGNILFYGEEQTLSRVLSIDQVKGSITVCYLAAILMQDGWTTLCSCNAVPITQDRLKKLGWAFYNGKTSGTMTKDCHAPKIDLDFVDGCIQTKSHYQGEEFYKKMRHIKYVHQLQNLYYFLTGEELRFS
jgi:hypothetical protein